MSNIGAVNSKAVLPTMPQARTTAGISADQKESMNKVLSQFDANNLSSADAKKITSAFKKIGVEPGRALEEVMAAAGFNAQQVGQLAFGAGATPAEGPGGSKGVDTVRSSLAELKGSMPPAGGPQGGPPPPPPAGGGQDVTDISSFLKELLDALSTSSSQSTSSTTTDTSFDKVLQSAAKLLKTNGMDASEDNLKSFMQIVQKNLVSAMNDKGSLIDNMT